MTNNFKILNWNCRSLYTKLSHFKIKLYAEKPQVACLCETWLKENRLPTFINYKSFFVCRNERSGGGLCILVQNDLSVSELKLVMFHQGYLEVQAVTIHGNGNKLDIMNVYNPSKTVSISEFEHYFEQLDGNRVIVGDFNAHHHLWDTNSEENSTGNNIADVLLNDPSLCLFTPRNLPTYYNIPNRKFSTLDLCIATVDLFCQSEVRIGDDLGSDHAPVYVDINFVPISTPFKRRSRWILNDKVWDKWCQSLPDKMEGNINLEESYDVFLNNIISTSEKFFRKTKEVVHPKFSKPWWNEKCNQAIGIRRQKKNYFHRHPNTTNLIELRKAEAIVKKICKESKKEVFKKFCNTLNKDTPSKKIWNYIGKLSNKSKNYHAQPISFNNQLITDSKEKANSIGSHFSNTFNCHRHTKSATSLMIPIALALTDEEDYDYNEPFRISELTNSISNLKSTSPGQDNLHNDMLKHLPLDYCRWALEIINQSFNSSHIPLSWKQTIILPILKPDKPPLDPASYRPISLLSCFGKLAEKLMCNRLNYIMEINNAYSPTQGGFRKRLCTLDQIARFESETKKALYERKCCIAIFFDLSKAYDGVWHLGLVGQLVRCGIRGKLLRWIEEFLKRRSYKVYYEGEFSDEFPISSGVPQGSILSPTLFNVMISNIPHVQGVNMAEYADDIVIYTSDSNVKLATQRLQRQVNELTKYLDEWGFQLNENKTKGLMLTLCKFTNPIIKINNIPIEFVQQYKYLGMTLDRPRLSWSSHIKILIDKCIKKVNIIKAISGHQWGADRVILLKLYKAIVRSIMDYGSIFYMTASRTLLDKLNKIQNTCLRIALGARKTSPILSLEVESHVPPLFIHRNSVLMKYYFRLCELPETVPVTRELFNENPTSLYYRAWSSTVRTAPCIVRCWKLLMSMQFPNGEPIYPDLISPIPPWIEIHRFLSVDFMSVTVKNASDGACIDIFKDLQSTKYTAFMEIYTDGSVFADEFSSSAAVVIDDHGNIITFNWRLSGLLSILSVEMYAIYRALEYIKDNLFRKTGVVIYSDSQSGILLLENTRPKTNIYMVYKIQSLLIELNRRFPVKIQYIPGHKNIKGNELADLAAKAGHNLESLTEIPVCKGDRTRRMKELQVELWEEHWKSEMELSGKGLHLYKIKKHVAFWEWTSLKERQLESALAKLRIGHVGVNSHLFRFNLNDIDLCNCGEVDSIEHFLFQCSQYTAFRTNMYHKLNEMGVPMTLRNILGGGDYSPEKQKLIICETAKYLKLTNRLGYL